MTQPQTPNRWSVVIGAILIQFCLGSIYAWSAFTVPLTAAGWTKTETQIVFSLELAVFALVMLYAGKLLATIHPRYLILTSGTLVGLGYLIAGAMGGTSFWAVTLSIGFITGTGLGMGYVVPIAVCMRWFPDKKGLITGIAVAGFGLGATCWGLLAAPWPKFLGVQGPNLLTTQGVGPTFMLFGAIFIVVVAIGSLFMKFPPDGWAPEGYVAPVASAGGSAAGTVDFTISEMLGTSQFWLIIIVFTAGSAAGLSCIGLIKLYAKEQLMLANIPEAIANGMGTFAMFIVFPICNAIGRIAWGTAGDKLGRKMALLLLVAIQGAIVLAFPILVSNEYGLYFCAGLIGFNFGGNFALFPTLTADTFGTKRVGQNYPVVFLAYGLGGIIGPIVGGKMGDLGMSPQAFTGCGIILLVCAVLVSLIKPASKPATA
ncbi:MAG: OFA family MFS transporter [Rhodospirillaceae bacterium]